ncbi:MAG: hypothetical protein IH620_05625 [Ignavibacterium sp.]|nr:hypothetical protein [Ignavibacterium sp.]
MKNITAKILFLFLFFSVRAFCQLEEDWPGYKVSIPFIRVIESKPIYKQSRIQTRVYPPQKNQINEIAGYIYTLEITLSINSNTEYFDKTVPVVFETPDRKTSIYYFNQEQILMRTNRLYDFIVEVRTRYLGYTQVGFLRKFSNSNIPTPVYENGLRLE